MSDGGVPAAGGGARIDKGVMRGTEPCGDGGNVSYSFCGEQGRGGRGRRRGEGEEQKSCNGRKTQTPKDGSGVSGTRPWAKHPQDFCSPETPLRGQEKRTKAERVHRRQRRPRLGAADAGSPGSEL